MRTLHADQRRQTEVAQTGPNPPAFLVAVQDEGRTPTLAGDRHLLLTHDLQPQGLLHQKQNHLENLPVGLLLEHLT